MMPFQRLMRRGLLVLLVLLLVVAGILIYRLPAATPVREMLRSVKDTSQDAATTSKVKTALLLSKHVSAFDRGLSRSVWPGARCVFMLRIHTERIIGEEARASRMRPDGPDGQARTEHEQDAACAVHRRNRSTFIGALNPTNPRTPSSPPIAASARMKIARPVLSRAAIP